MSPAPSPTPICHAIFPDAAYGPAASIVTALLWVLLITFVLVLFRAEFAAILSRFKEATVGPVTLKAGDQQELGSARDVADDSKLPAPPREYIEALERALRLGDDLDTTRAELLRYYTGWRFEQTYRFIYGSQLMLLWALAELTPFTDKKTVEAAYNTSKQQGNAQTFDQWLGFLASAGFIAVNPFDEKEFVTITDVGRTFWEYLKQWNISTIKQY